MIPVVFPAHPGTVSGLSVYGDCKPSDNFQKAHVIDRRTQFCSGQWTVSNRFLLSTVSFRDLRPRICFALRLLIPGRPRSLFHALSCPFMPFSTAFFYPFFVKCPNIFCRISGFSNSVLSEDFFPICIPSSFPYLTLILLLLALQPPIGGFYFTAL